MSRYLSGVIKPDGDSSGDYSPATVSIYRWALGLLLRHMGDLEVSAITPVHLKAFLVWLGTEYRPARRTEPVKPSTVQNAWVAIRSFFNWAAPEFSIGERPDRDLKRPKFKYPQITPFTQAEIQALLKACLATAPSQGRKAGFVMGRAMALRDQAVILVLLDTGVRIGELARLRVRDVNLESGEVFIAPFRTGRKTKSRHVYLGRASRRALWRYLAKRELRPDDPLFITGNNRLLSRDGYHLVLRRLGARARVANVHPHRFRHTFAIMFLRNGGDVFTLQRFLGHSSLEMTQRYLALADTDVEDAQRRASPVDGWRL